MQAEMAVPDVQNAPKEHMKAEMAVPDVQNAHQEHMKTNQDQWSVNYVRVRTTTKMNQDRRGVNNVQRTRDRGITTATQTLGIRHAPRVGRISETSVQRNVKHVERRCT